jgi:ABC-2 type transport system permease protein
LIFLLVFGVFRFDEPQTFKVAVVDNARDQLSQGLISNLGSVELLKLDTALREPDARQALKDGKVDFVLVLPTGLAQATVGQGKQMPITLLYDESRLQTNQVIVSVVQRYLDQTNLAIQGARPLLQLDAQGLAARRHRYFDFLLPGFIGMGVMTYSVIGLATAISVYRQQKIFKRILATPLRVRDFFIAQIAAYLLLSLAQAAIILAAGVGIFHATIGGNLGYLFLLVLLGNTVFLNLGFIVGSFSNTVQAASGLGNLVTVPMMFFSGVFFPTDTLPRVMAAIVQYLPLTPLLDAMRGVLLEGNTPWSYPRALAILGTWIVATAVVAVRTFRFD